MSIGTEEGPGVAMLGIKGVSSEGPTCQQLVDRGVYQLEFAHGAQASLGDDSCVSEARTSPVQP